MSPTLKSFGGKIWKGWDGVDRCKPSGRGLSYTKESVSITSAVSVQCSMHERERQTDHRTVTQNRFQRCRLKLKTFKQAYWTSPYTFNYSALAIQQIYGHVMVPNWWTVTCQTARAIKNLYITESLSRPARQGTQHKSFMQHLTVGRRN